MVDERHEYEALIPINDPGTGRAAYLPGHGVHAQVVEDWGLVVGEHGDEQAQVVSLRPQQMARPGANASRDEWFRYRSGQPGADRAALEDMGRNALRDMDDDATDGQADEEQAATGSDPDSVAGEEQAAPVKKKER